MSRFLTFVVEETLAGRGNDLKETIIGVQVFDKPACYDPNADATVRVEAAKLRTRLARYYQEQGTSESLIISIPKGGYIPAFDAAPEPVVEAEIQADPEPPLTLTNSETPAVPVLAPPVASVPRASSTRVWREAAAWCAAALLAAVLMLNPSTATTERRGSTTVRFEILPPEGTNFLPVDQVGPASISPDSSSLAFVAQDGMGVRRLYVRQLDDVHPKAVVGSENAAFPFWSPDSRHIGFFSDGELRKHDLQTGLISRLARAANGRGGAWSKSGTILFAPSSLGALYAVSDRGGTAEPVAPLASSELSQQQPTFLPDGDQFLYLSTSKGATYAQLFRGSLSGKLPSRAIAATNSAAAIFDNQLVHTRSQELVAQSFAPDTLELRGPARILSRDVVVSNDVADFSATSRVLAHRSSSGNHWTIELRQ